MIKTVNLSRTFTTRDGEVKAVDDVNITLPDTGLVFIIGKSGSGKSTLLNLLAGYDLPTTGNIFVDDRDITKFSQQELSDYQFLYLGFVFQNYSLIENLTVAENIALGSKSGHHRLKKEIDQVLSDVGLKNYGKKMVSKLSGGEKQRVALARAILKKPKIILCDEPCGNLDVVSSKTIIGMLKKQAKRALVVVVSHNLNDAYTHADRILTLQKGQIIEDKVFDKKRTKQKDIKFITDFNEMTEEQVETINAKLNSGEIKAIMRRKDFFINTADDDSEIEESEEKYVPPRGYFVPTILGVLNRNIPKVGTFSVLIGLALALFSICYAIESFNGDGVFESAFNNYESTAVSYNKGLETGIERSQYATTFYSKITDEDRALIANSGYSGNVYELYNISLYTLSYESAGASHKIVRNGMQSTTNFSSFFTSETGGVLVADEDFIKQNLKLETLDIQYASTQEDSGILITDYVADSFVTRLSEIYSSRSSVLGEYNDSIFNYKVYINGIIDTDYEEMFKHMREELVSNADGYLSLIDEENIELYEFLKNSLNIAYTTNENFLEDYRQYNLAAPQHGIKYYFSDGLQREIDSISISYSTALEDNEAMVDVEGLRSLYPNMSNEQIEAAINSGEGKSRAEILKWNKKNTSKLDIDWPQYEFDYIHVFERGVSDDYYNSTACPLMWRRNYVSKNVYEKILDDTFFSYSFYLDDVDGAIALKNTLVSNTIYPNSEIYAAAMDLTDAISAFDTIFILLSVTSAVIAAIIVGYYGFNLVSANKYNIGIFKALGYRGKELTGYYLITLLIFFGVVSAWYIFFYWLFLSICNNFLIESIAYYITQKVTYFTKFGIFNFSPAMVISVLGSFLGILALITLVYLLVLRRFRAIRILQDKD